MNDVKHQEFLANIAQDFYISKMTVTELSQKYDLSRYLINKSLDEALSSGLVKISVATPITRNLELEMRFKKEFGIRDAFIIKDSDTPNDNNENIIEYAAEEIQNLIRKSRVVGLTWGDTVLSTIAHFQTQFKDDVVFTQFVGDNMKYNSLSGATPIVEKAATKFGAPYLTMPGPLYIMNNDARIALQKEPALFPAFNTASRMDLLFTGIGTLSSVDTIPVWKQHQAEIFKGVDLEQVAGMLYGRPYDINGNILNMTDDKTFGISVDNIMTTTHRIGIVKSKFKARALLGALRGQLLTEVVTNEAVANRVLLEENENPVIAQ
ncbi:MAG: sugar-binding domain-containing protein [Lentilactobacillus diolivorans]|uniref:Citrate lyase regulator n=2 Tax=Lentilactobacillus diolivorans TaxID=179838 RepID=A0A0R1SRJ4_9LACO|nr:sugar-binding domain-containing protein [Lentilactobacillus diolivorans]KRL69106.1 citrate lyase regulator [Lentilactobacillus diolivorans DSM 14421]MDH5104586.1 sugar-binding transcriptional regulator [Lentilactobacillus diolivorans]GEP22447.1 citrate lyase [Lentilactobacillus diolivorans]